MLEIGPNLTTVILSAISLVTAILSLIRAELSIRATSEVKSAVDTNTTRIARLENGK